MQFLVGRPYTATLLEPCAVLRTGIRFGRYDEACILLTVATLYVARVPHLLLAGVNKHLLPGQRILRNYSGPQAQLRLLLHYNDLRVAWERLVCPVSAVLYEPQMSPRYAGVSLSPFIVNVEVNRTLLNECSDSRNAKARIVPAHSGVRGSQDDMNPACSSRSDREQFSVLTFHELQAAKVVWSSAQGRMSQIYL